MLLINSVTSVSVAKIIVITSCDNLTWRQSSQCCWTSITSKCQKVTSNVGLELVYLCSKEKVPLLNQNAYDFIQENSSISSLYLDILYLRTLAFYVKRETVTTWIGHQSMSGLRPRGRQPLKLTFSPLGYVHITCWSGSNTEMRFFQRKCEQTNKLGFQIRSVPHLYVVLDPIYIRSEHIITETTKITDCWEDGGPLTLGRSCELFQTLVSLERFCSLSPWPTALPNPNHLCLRVHFPWRLITSC